MADELKQAQAKVVAAEAAAMADRNAVRANVADHPVRDLLVVAAVALIIGLIIGAVFF